MAGKKCSKAEKQTRISKVVEMILSGISRIEILGYISDNWHLSERMGENYLIMAGEEISKEAKAILKNSVATALALRMYIYNRALKDNDNRLCLTVLQDIGKMLDLYPAARIQTQNLNIDFTDLSNYQLEQIANGAPVNEVLKLKSED